MLAAVTAAELPHSAYARSSVIASSTLGGMKVALVNSN